MRKLILLFILILSIKGASQEEDNDFAYLEKIIPPSPTASSLGTYGNLPINLSNGSPNVNLPIYNLQVKNINIPISIAYNSNGVRIDDVPRQLGVDWNLLVGGVVTHTVYDEDDLSNATYFDMEGDFCSNITDSGREISSSGVDSQKDIFNYNVMGISGAFVLDENEEPVQLDYSDNKIEKINNGPNNTYILGFKITDIQGNQYYFGELQDGDPVVEKTLSRSLCGSPSPPNFYTTAWFLTSIHNITGETVIFHYTDEDFNYVSSYEQTAVASILNGFPNVPFAISVPCGITERHFTYYLDEIDYKSNKVKFDYIDYNNTVFLPEQLETISVYNDVNLIKKLEFNYDEISPNTSSGLTNDYSENDVKRIFLKEVIEYDSSEQNSFKKYGFDYYSPEDLPPRHSFSKDIYGYYNGAHNTNLIYKNWSEDYDNAMHFNFPFSIANRNPNGLSEKGMLHHIYYPTGGNSEFIYEANVLQTEETVYPPLTTIQIGLEPEPIHGLREVVSDPFSVPYNQMGIFYAYGDIILDIEGCDHYINPDGSNSFPKPHAQFSAILKNLTTNSNVANMGFEESLNGPMNVPLLVDNLYQLSYQMNWECMGGSTYIKFVGSEPYTQYINVPVGGMRVKKTLDHDNNDNEFVKRYYYGDLNNIDGSSFQYNVISPNYTLNFDRHRITFDNPYSEGEPSYVKDNYIIYSTPKTPLFNINGNFFSYGNVIESLGGDNFEKGGISHTFSGGLGGIPGQVCGESYVRGTPFSNGHNPNKEVKISLFKKEEENYIITSISENNYEHKNIGLFNFANLSYNIGESLLTVFSAPGGGYNTDHIYLFNTLQYDLTGEAWYLASTKTTVYDTNGENPVETTTTYTYDSADHLQPTSQTTTNSNGEKHITKYEYPPDLIGVEQGPYMQDLTDANRIAEPVITETKLKIGANTEKTSEKHIKYGNSSSTGNLLLPTEIHTKKGSGDINIASVEDRKITYTKYDTNGNLLEYKLENGTPVSIIWGYNKQYPIAKVEGALYTDLSAYITALQSASDNGTLTMNDFDDLREDLSSALVTTYIYKPLIGVTDILYPNGSAEYYEYDEFGRLKQVKNTQDEVIKKMEYHYKTP